MSDESSSSSGGLGGGTVALSGGDAYIVDPADRRITAATPNAPGGAACLPDGLGTVVAAGSPVGALVRRMAVVATDGSVVVLVDLDSASCETIPLDPPIGGASVAALDDGFVYVADAETGSVLGIPLDGAERGVPSGLRGIRTSNHRFELFERNGQIWSNDLDSPVAAVLADGEFRYVIDKNGVEADSADTGTWGEGGDSLITESDDENAFGPDSAETEQQRTAAKLGRDIAAVEQALERSLGRLVQACRSVSAT